MAAQGPHGFPLARPPTPLQGFPPGFQNAQAVRPIPGPLGAANGAPPHLNGLPPQMHGQQFRPGQQRLSTPPPAGRNSPFMPHHHAGPPGPGFIPPGPTPVPGSPMTGKGPPMRPPGDQLSRGPTPLGTPQPGFRPPMGQPLGMHAPPGSGTPHPPLEPPGYPLGPPPAGGMQPPAGPIGPGQQPGMTPPPVDAMAAQMAGMGLTNKSPRSKRAFYPANPAVPSQPAGPNGQPPAGPPGFPHPDQASNGVHPPMRPPMPPQFNQKFGPPQPGQPPQMIPPPQQQQPGAPPHGYSPHTSHTDLGAINQPHQPQQPRSRIDPNQIPSPVAVQETDQNNYNAQAFMSMAKGVPPLALTEYTAIDEGNATPRFIRATTYNIPLNDETANSSNLPMGLVIQPLADLGPKEQPISVVDFGAEGPVRCQRCRAYINPFVVFTEGGRKFACNLCTFETEVPPDYFCNLDMSGRRMDFDQRPELQFGTVEFVATKEFCNRAPETAAYVFVIDVSWNAVKSGMLAQCVSSLREFLYGGRPRRSTTGLERPPGLESGCKIGFITFDSTVHFYNLKESLEQPQMLVIGDINDVFVPIHEGFLVDPIESKPAIESLLEMLPKMFENTTSNQPVLGAAVQAAYLALKARGGKISVFQTVLPLVGPGALKNREDVKLLGTDKEKTLYEPQEYFWKKLAQDCSENGVCVDLYVFPNAYVDVATIGVLSSLTGGDIYHYLNFDVQRDGIKFGNDLIKNLSRNFGYDGLLRVRCSNGLKITEHMGNFYMKNATDVELAGIDSHKSLAITVKHEGKLDERTDAYFQCALLYTTSAGQRRIRVINLTVTPTQSLGNVFRYADMDTTITYLCKLAVNTTITTSLASVREQLTNRCVKILSSYRRHCATSTAPGQLILPESFKLYPMYSLSMLKSKAFRGGQEMSSDLRVYNFRMLKSMTARDTMMLMYPVLRPLHDLDVEAFTRDGNVKLPPAVRVSYERLDQSGAYLVDNGQQMFLWLGRHAKADLLKMVFSVEGVEQIDAKLRVLPPLDNPYSAYVRAIVNRVQSQNSRYSNFQVVRHSLDPYIEVQFLNMMLEDKNNDNMNYVDYLCAVHRSIQLELSNNT